MFVLYFAFIPADTVKALPDIVKRRSAGVRAGESSGPEQSSSPSAPLGATTDGGGDAQSVPTSNADEEERAGPRST